MTSYEAAGTFQRGTAGREFWCAAIRASFEVQPDGTLKHAAKQVKVNLTPGFAGENNEILLADDDMIPFAPITDILIRGVAEPAITEHEASALSAQIGALHKRATLHPPRRARLQRGKWSLIDRAEQRPSSLGWEASFGGILSGQPVNEPPENPLGMGVELRAPELFDEGAEINLPGIEGFGMDCTKNPKTSRGVGFGPIPRWWRARLTLAGRFEEAWRRDHSPAMPADHDPHFACSASREQWPDGHLRGGEPVCLQGFTGSRDWRFRLPQALFRVETKLNHQIKRVPTHLARVDLWPHAGLVSMLWLGVLDCNGQDEKVGTTRIALQQLFGVSA